MSQYYGHYTGSGQDNRGNVGGPRFQGEERGRQFNPGNLHPIQGANSTNLTGGKNVNSQNLTGGTNGNVMDNGSYGGYPVINPPPMPPGGTYNPTEVLLRKTQMPHSRGVYADRHFSQNRQSLGEGSLVQEPELSDYYTDTRASIKQEPDIVYSTKERYLFVNSKDRNLSTFPQPQNYVVHMNPANDINVQSAAVGEIYRNVISVELIGGTLPDQAAVGAVTDHPFFLLHIDELENTFEGTNRDNKTAFAVLQLDSPVSAGGFINIKTDMNKIARKYFDPPLAQLSRLSIRITDQFGADFDFGTDIDPIDVALQHSFMFRVTERVVDTKQMQSRSLFN